MAVLDISETLPSPLKYKSGTKAKLEWERVNEATWKLTDGTSTNVPTSYGQWGGYRTPKAVAWAIDVGVTKPAWLARYKDQCAGPMPLKEAKAAARAMAKGAAGDYSISQPIEHLNEIAARLLDKEERVTAVNAPRHGTCGEVS